jgi:LPXTG-motif cell wall-anchored protein
MDKSKFAKVAGACALALSCMAVTPVVAQEVPPVGYAEQDNFDWGWIGLFGLIGLAGLMGRKRDTRYEANRTTTTPVR